jgi:hypothetical protein
MKRVILIITAVVATSGIYAQSEEYREHFTIGLRIGGNLSNVYDSDGEEFDADAKLGFAGGAFIGIPISEQIGIQAEVLVSQKGFVANGQVLGSQYSLKRTTTFLDIPLMLAIKPAEAFTIFVGPQFSYLMHRRDKFESAFVNTELETEFENENFRKNILGAVVGFDINVQQIVFGIRAGIDLQKNNGDGNSDTPRYKNTWVQATVGFRL